MPHEGRLPCHHGGAISGHAPPRHPPPQPGFDGLQLLSVITSPAQCMYTEAAEGCGLNTGKHQCRVRHGSAAASPDEASALPKAFRPIFLAGGRLQARRSSSCASRGRNNIQEQPSGTTGIAWPDLVQRKGYSKEQMTKRKTSKPTSRPVHLRSFAKCTEIYQPSHSTRTSKKRINPVGKADADPPRLDIRFGRFAGMQTGSIDGDLLYSSKKR